MKNADRQTCVIFFKKVNANHLYHYWQLIVSPGVLRYIIGWEGTARPPKPWPCLPWTQNNTLIITYTLIITSNYQPGKVRKCRRDRCNVFRMNKSLTKAYVLWQFRGKWVWGWRLLKRLGRIQVNSCILAVAYLWFLNRHCTHKLFKTPLVAGQRRPELHCSQPVTLKLISSPS